MKGNVSASNPAGIIPTVSAQVVRTSQNQAATYQKVCDERKRPLLGLWVCNGRYYAQMTVEDPAHRPANKSAACRWKGR
jgi:hypothetical protein